MRPRDTSRILFAEAQKLFPGGVNSPVRAFRGVGGEPFFVVRAAGGRLYDADGNAYIDYVMSWGPLILGHAPPPVLSALKEALGKGTSYGAPTLQEIELARLIREAVPSMEMLRLVNSGTEATMSALRLARAFTGRDKIVKFAGCYHGHADLLLVQAGSGATTMGIPNSAGVPPATVRDTLVAEFNDLTSVQRLYEEYPRQIAAVIVEPVAGNMGVIPPQAGFLQGLREITAREGSLLIFDEVITGFRVAYGGAQALYGVRPDLTCLGKIIGGGLPVGAYGGRREIMELVAPVGPVYQAGTLAGNPLATTAGIATLKELQKPGIYETLEGLGARLATGLEAAAEEAKIPLVVNRVGSMLTAFLTHEPVIDYPSAQRADTAQYATFFYAMLDQGIYLAPSQFEAAFISLAHIEEDIEFTLRATAQAFAKLQESR